MRVVEGHLLLLWLVALLVGTSTCGGVIWPRLRHGLWALPEISLNRLNRLAALRHEPVIAWMLVARLVSYAATHHVLSVHVGAASIRC